MEQYQNSVQDTKGNALPALIQVAFLGTNNLAPIFSDNGVTPKGNPFPADDTGEYRFYAANGRYTITVSYQDKFDRVYDALMYDPVDSPLTAQALKDALANVVDPVKGAALVGFNYQLNYAVNTIGWAVQNLLINVQWFGAKGDGVTDDAAAIQAAMDFVPYWDNPNRQPGGVFFPTPKKFYKTGSPLKLIKRQGYKLYGDGAVIQGNFAGYILEVGDNTGPNDVLWATIENLEFQQVSVAVGSGAVKAVHNYTCRYVNCRFFGGEYSFNLDGNANVISGCSFRNGKLANVKTGAAANNEANMFLCCSNELSAGYGYDLSVVAGVGGFTHIIGGYCEANVSGNIFAANSCKVIVEDIYFNLQNGASGVVLGGTVGADYAAPPVTVRNCRVEGPAIAPAVKFIRELSTTSINCTYENNTSRGGLVDLYGAAEKSINLRRRRDKIYVANLAFTGGPPPTGWTLSGPGPASGTTSNSQYGGPGSVQITGVSYIHQLIKFPANALLRISGWALTTGTDATIELWDAAIGAKYGGQSSASNVPVRLEFYITPTARANATSGRLLLRNLTGVNNAYLDGDLVIEDMTN